MRYKWFKFHQLECCFDAQGRLARNGHVYSKVVPDFNYFLTHLESSSIVVLDVINLRVVSTPKKGLLVNGMYAV